jgi:Type IV secretory pathway, VirB10 components
MVNGCCYLIFVVCVSAYIVSSSTVAISEIKAEPLLTGDCPEFRQPEIIEIKNKQAPITQIANYVNIPDPVEYGKQNQTLIEPEIKDEEIEAPEKAISQAKIITKVIYEQRQTRLAKQKVEQFSSYQMFTWIPESKQSKNQSKESKEEYNQLQGDIDAITAGFNTSEIEKQRETRKKYYAEAMKASENVYLKSCRIQAPEYSLPIGTIIKCRLLSAISTENPGDWIVNAKVTKPVYGGHKVGETWLAIPAETKIILSYSFEINYGNHSVPATANMLIFPDESFMQIPGFPAVELSGVVGLSGKVNNRWPRIITVAGITSFLGYIPMRIAENWEEQSASRHVALGVSQGVNQAGIKF